MKKYIIDIIKSLNIDYTYLSKYPYRTHLFTGSKNKIEKQFVARYNNKKYPDCILRQLYCKINPNTKYNLDEVVWFENMNYDCVYLSKPRNYGEGLYGEMFPLDWDYNWIIELENNINEFGFTLRTLLDANCKNRLAIYFSDSYQECDLDYCFRKYWKIFISNYPKLHNLNLHCIIFPEKYINENQYYSNTKTFKWDEDENKFIEYDMNF